jgi:hypothetical protein
VAEYWRKEVGRDDRDCYPVDVREEEKCMNSALTEIDGKMIATSVAKREKALLILKAARRPSSITIFVILICSVVGVNVGLSGLESSFWPKLIVSVACILSFYSAAFAWRIQSQLSAVIEVLMQSEDQKH